MKQILGIHLLCHVSRQVSHSGLLGVKGAVPGYQVVAGTTETPWCSMSSHS